MSMWFAGCHGGYHYSLCWLELSGAHLTCNIALGRGRRYNGSGLNCIDAGQCVHIMSLESFHLKHNPL